VLRYWKSVPALTAIPVIVWTAAREQDRRIAAYFHVAAVVEKARGLNEFEAALQRVIAGE